MVRGHGINPKVDFVFRLLFSSEQNKDLLISLINSVIEPAIRIVDVTIKNPFNLATYRSAKESILDNACMGAFDLGAPPPEMAIV